MTLLILPLLLAADPVTADKPPDLPAPVEVRAAPGVPVVLRSGTPGGWELAREKADAAWLIPFPDGSGAYFVGSKSGDRVLVLVTRAAGEKPAPADRVVVVVGPPPDPEPAPPPKPKPDDALVRAFKDAVLADPAPAAEKAKQLADLAELYRQAAGFARAAEVASVADVVARVRTAAVALNVTGLPAVRAKVAAELAAVFPGDAPLTDESRAALAALFTRLSAALRAAGE